MFYAIITQICITTGDDLYKVNRSVFRAWVVCMPLFLIPTYVQHCHQCSFWLTSLLSKSLSKLVAQRVWGAHQLPSKIAQDPRTNNVTSLAWHVYCFLEVHCLSFSPCFPASISCELRTPAASVASLFHTNSLLPSTLSFQAFKVLFILQIFLKLLQKALKELIQ